MPAVRLVEVVSGLDGLSSEGSSVRAPIPRSCKLENEIEVIDGCIDAERNMVDAAIHRLYEAF